MLASLNSYLHESYAGERLVKADSNLENIVAKHTTYQTQLGQERSWRCTNIEGLWYYIALYSVYIWMYGKMCTWKWIVHYHFNKM